MAKYSIIGKGKTGIVIIKLLQKATIQNIFDSKIQVTLEKLKGISICFIFVSATILAKLEPILLYCTAPIICGTTGYKWSKKTHIQVKKRYLTWVVSNNFSLGMLFLYKLFNLCTLPQNQNFKFTLEETHHLNKKDAPSGTILSWKKWLKIPTCYIKINRKNDIIGEHKFILNNQIEIIKITHKALNRNVFANGAIWAANYILKKPVRYGIINFFNLNLKND